MALTTQKASADYEFSGTLTGAQWRFFAWMAGMQDGHPRCPKLRKELNLDGGDKITHYSSPEFTPADHAEVKRLIDKYAPMFPKQKRI